MADQIRPGVYLLDDAPEFVLKDGLVRIQSQSGGVRFEMVCTINQFYRGSERARLLREQLAKDNVVEATFDSKFERVLPKDKPT
jgi:hypothetical protein